MMKILNNKMWALRISAAHVTLIVFFNYYLISKNSEKKFLNKKQKQTLKVQYKLAQITIKIIIIGL